PVPTLLLFDLPKDGGWGRLLHQHERRRFVPRGRRARSRASFSGPVPAQWTRRTEQARAALLRRVRQPPLGVAPRLARAHPSSRRRVGHALFATARERAPHGWLEGIVGRGRGQEGRRGVRWIPIR